MNKKYLEKAIATIAGVGFFALIWKTFGSCIPIIDTLPAGFGIMTAGGVLGCFGSDDLAKSVEIIKYGIKESFKLSDENEELDDEYVDEDEEQLVDVIEEEDTNTNVFDDAFYFEDDYYKDIIKWYNKLGSFKEAREFYCESRGLEYTPLDRFSWDIDFLKDTIITIVDVCSDKIMEQAENDADVASIINGIAYNLVYNAGYYTVVNGMDVVDNKNVIFSIHNDVDDYSYEERKEIVDRLCNMTGVVNPLTRKHLTLDEGNEEGKGKIIQFGK